MRWPTSPPNCLKAREKGSTQAIRQEDQGQLSAFGSPIDAAGSQSPLRGRQGHSSLSCSRPVMASCRRTHPLRGRHTPPEGRSCACARIFHWTPWISLSLWSALENRALLQAGPPPDRIIRNPFFDAGYAAAAPPQRQSVFHRQSDRPCLHPSQGGRPRSAPISRDRWSQAAMGLVRILAANHSSGHPTLRICRCRGPAPNTSRFSLSLLQSLRSSEIHRRSARNSKYGDIPHDGMTRTRHSRVTVHCGVVIAGNRIGTSESCRPRECCPFL